MIMFEPPYLYNMLDGKQYPLLADGDYAWNDAHTEIKAGPRMNALSSAFTMTWRVWAWLSQGVVASPVPLEPHRPSHQPRTTS